MDIYAYAMQMEKDGEQLYRELAQETRNTGLRNIFIMLADAEVGHYNTFKKLKTHEKVDLPDTMITTDVKNIFVKIREAKEISNLDISQVNLYRKAQEIEKRSEEFYIVKGNEVDDEAQRNMFRKIADEEHKHFSILESIVDFVSRPEQWLENSEWYDLE